MEVLVRVTQSRRKSAKGSLRDKKYLKFRASFVNVAISSALTKSKLLVQPAPRRRIDETDYLPGTGTGRGKKA